MTVIPHLVEPHTQLAAFKLEFHSLSNLQPIWCKTSGESQDATRLPVIKTFLEKKITFLEQCKTCLCP